MTWLYAAVLIARLSARVAVLETRYAATFYWVQDGPDEPKRFTRNGHYQNEVSR